MRKNILTTVLCLPPWWKNLLPLQADKVMVLNNGIKVFRYLQATGMPSVLIEVGFLSNKEEEEYLNSDKGQDEVVQNIIDALERYKNQVEGGASSVAPASLPGFHS